jgi:hypothetical protein
MGMLAQPAQQHAALNVGSVNRMAFPLEGARACGNTPPGEAIGHQSSMLRQTSV